MKLRFYMTVESSDGAGDGYARSYTRSFQQVRRKAREYADFQLSTLRDDDEVYGGSYTGPRSNCHVDLHATLYEVEGTPTEVAFTCMSIASDCSEGDKCARFKRLKQWRWDSKSWSLKENDINEDSTLSQAASRKGGLS